MEEEHEEEKSGMEIEKNNTKLSPSGNPVKLIL